MKFVIDEQLPPALAGWLRQKGHEASHVRDVGLRSAPDEVIRQYAEGADVIVTKDEDFVVHRQKSATGAAVLWLRIGNVTNRKLLTRLDADWPRIEAVLLSGAPVIQVRS